MQKVKSTNLYDFSEKASAKFFPISILDHFFKFNWRFFNFIFII